MNTTHNINIDWRQVGEKIKKIRKSFSLNQKQFAECVELPSQEMVSHYEKGKSRPSIEDLLKIARFGKKSLDWLLTNEAVTSWDLYSLGERVSIDKLVEIMRYKSEDNKKLVQHALDMAAKSPDIIKYKSAVKIAVGETREPTCIKCGKLQRESPRRRADDCRCDEKEEK